jgi:excisionase family DNA binding protein
MQLLKKEVSMLTVAQVAQRLGIKEATVRLWLAQRRISYIKLGRARKSSIRVPETEIDRLIRNSTVPAVADDRRR